VSTPAKLPDLTPELIEAARWFAKPENIGVRDCSSMPKNMQAALLAYRDAVDTTMHIGCAAIHILTRALSAHRPTPMGGTKVGDWVRPCYEGGKYTRTGITRLADRAHALCPFRGVYAHGGWHRSWVRVKGGAA